MTFVISSLQCYTKNPHKHEISLELFENQSELTSLTSWEIPILRSVFLKVPVGGRRFRFRLRPWLHYSQFRLSKSNKSANK